MKLTNAEKQKRYRDKKVTRKVTVTPESNAPVTPSIPARPTWLYKGQGQHYNPMMVGYVPLPRNE